MREKGWLVRIFHSSPDMEPDLRSKRTIHPITGREMKHTVSRHCDLGVDELSWPNGQKFGRGSQFPSHVSAGDISRIQKIVLVEYQNFKKGRRNNILNCQDAGGADKVMLKLEKYGVEIVGAFIRNGSICTVFPVEERKRE